MDHYMSFHCEANKSSASIAFKSSPRVAERRTLRQSDEFRILAVLRQGEVIAIDQHI